MITWKRTRPPSETELTRIHPTRRKPNWIYKQTTFVGKGYLHTGTNTFYFPLSRWKNTCYCTANILVTCAKAKNEERSPSFSERKKTTPLLKPWLQEVQHYGHHLFLSAKEPNIYFGNKVITNSQSCFPKKFSSISGIFLCSAKHQSVPHRAPPLQPGQHLLVVGWQEKGIG